MELSWTVRGAYANWTMTVSTTPTPDGHADEWPEEPLLRLRAHFRDVVDHLEAARCATVHDSIGACTQTTSPSHCGSPTPPTRSPRPASAPPTSW